MPDQQPPEDADFTDEDEMAGMTPEERAEYEETLAAIREGIADMEAGRMIPISTLIEEMRRKQAEEESK